MKYAVMSRGHMALKTNSLKEARAKLEELGENSFIYYGKTAIAEYEKTHDPVNGESELANSNG